MNERILGLILLLLALPAWAAGPIPGLPIAQDTRLAQYAHDLVGSDPHDRTYAAREILRRVKRARRIAGRDTDAIEVLEARQDLIVFDTDIAPKCIRQLIQPDLVRPCARILGLLETDAALQPLRDALRSEQRRGARRAITEAIAQIGEQGATP